MKTTDFRCAECRDKHAQEWTADNRPVCIPCAERIEKK